MSVIDSKSQAGLGRLHDAMAARVAKGELPGMVTLVARGGDVHVDTIGTLAFGSSEPMRRDTIFRITSMTKPILALATMILVEDRALALNEPVDRLLPELADRKVLRRIDGPLDETVPARRPITVDDLLTFRMGHGLIMEPTFDPPFPIVNAAHDLQLVMGPPDPRTPFGPNEWMKRFATLPLMYQPGDRWQYNTGSLVLGVLVGTRLWTASRGFPSRPHLRTVGYEGHRVLDFGGAGPSAAEQLHDQLPDREDGIADRIGSDRLDHAAGVPVGGRRPRVDDRRLLRVCSFAPEPRNAQGQATRSGEIRPPHDSESFDTRADGNGRSDPRRPGLGFPPGSRDCAGRGVSGAGPLWLEWRLRDLLVQRPRPEPGRDRDDSGLRRCVQRHDDRIREAGDRL